METCLQIFAKTRALLGVTGIVLMLTACGGGGGGGDIFNDAVTDNTASTLSSDTGSASDGGSSSGSDTSSGADTGANGDTGSGDSGTGGGTVDLVETPPPPQELGSASLSWQAPVERADGTPLQPAEIAGYRIYYGTKSGDYPHRIDIDGGDVTGYVITDLPVDGYYFVVTTLDSENRESSYSNEAFKQVQS